MLIIVNPATHNRPQFFDDFRQFPTPSSSQYSFDFGFMTFHAGRSNLQPRLFVKGHAVAEETAVPRTVYGTFTPVDFEFQLVFEVLGHRGHNPLRAALGLQINVAVIGVTAKAMFTEFQFLV